MVALVQIDMGNVGSWAEAHRLPFTTFKDLSRKPEVAALIGEAVARVNQDLPAGGPHPGASPCSTRSWTPTTTS